MTRRSEPHCMAGHSANTEPTEDEIARADRIGFSILPEQTETEIRASSNVFYKGNTALLGPRWIALIPSRVPSEREVSAIASIAAAFADNPSNSFAETSQAVTNRSTQASKSRSKTVRGVVI